MSDLRWYQREAVEATHAAREHGVKRPLIAIPTGGGKSRVLARLATDFAAMGLTVVVLAHVAELVEQNAKAINAEGKGLCGVLAAKLKKRVTSRDITSASVQSLGAYLRKKTMQADVVIVDEAHMIPRRDDAQYQKVLAALNPSLTVGLTATAFRLDSGRLHEGDDATFDELSYEVDLGTLIEQGYLAPLVEEPTQARISTHGLAKRAGDFAANDLEKRAIAASQGVVDDLVPRIAKRGQGMLFASGLRHAGLLNDMLGAAGVSARMLTGDMSDTARAACVADYRAGRFKVLVTVAVATTGFDVPQVDWIALVRPTQSPGLYIQMIGRGTRLAPGKTCCVIFDYAGNIARLGPPDAPHIAEQLDEEDEDEDTPPSGNAPKKMCPECLELCHPSCKECPTCSAWFPPKLVGSSGEGALVKGAPWLRVADWGAWLEEGFVRLVFGTEAGDVHARLDAVGEDAATWRRMGGGDVDSNAQAVEQCDVIDGPRAVRVEDKDGMLILRDVASPVRRRRDREEVQEDAE